MSNKKSEPTSPAPSRLGLAKRFWDEQTELAYGPGHKELGFVKRFFREQKALVFGGRAKELLGQTGETLRRVKDLKVSPTRIETFEAAVARKRLSPAQLDSQLRRFKNVHLALYAIAGLLMVYALYLALNFNIFFGLGAFVAALGAAVNGYLHGFRAWQIENRNLIKLQDAVRVPATYLVL
jgi:hypothetical protein